MSQSSDKMCGERTKTLQQSSLYMGWGWQFVAIVSVCISVMLFW